MRPPTRITVLISGAGTNLQALIDAQKAGAFSTPVAIVRVLSNRKAAFGLERATQHGIPTGCHSLKPYKDRHGADGAGVAAARAEYDADLARAVLGDAPDLVVCAGWMHVLSDAALAPLRDRRVWIVNLHPALPGQFNGANAIQRAHREFMAGEIRKTGVMVHKVIAAVDEGDPLVVKELELEHPRDDALDVLERRIHEAEWKAIVKGTDIAIRKLWEERKEFV